VGTSGARIKRSSPTIRTPNEFLYGQSGLAWTRSKRTGRRFGYYPTGGLFSHTGYLFVPKDSELLWTILGGINSDLYHSLFLSITVERDWVGGVVGKAPWIEELAGQEGLEELSKEQYEMKRRASLSILPVRITLRRDSPRYFRERAVLRPSPRGCWRRKVVDGQGSNRT